MKRDTVGIYVHIPFCVSKCGYCDFKSEAKAFSKVERYLGALKKEINLYADMISSQQLDTVFIGGGTPTAIDPNYIESILEEIFKLNRGTEDIEVTIEGNPDDYTPEQTKRYIDMGINRFSIGVQSFDRVQLESIERRCPSKTIEEIVEGMRGVGATNISIDIMFGLPSQTVENSKSDIEKAISLGVEHISLYSLKVEEGTPLYEKESRDELEFPSEQDERAMYHSAIETLQKEGYSQYEISNFSLKERESKHNSRYWELRPYIGLGLSASSNLEHKRYKNVSAFPKYFEIVGRGKKPIDRESIEDIDEEMEMSEYMILGLRLNRGISVKHFIERFDVDPLEFYEEVFEKYDGSDMILVDGDRIALTQKGFDLCNQIFCDLLPD